MGLKLSVEKTRITHWDKPITFLGYHIHGELRDRGVQIKAVLTIQYLRQLRKAEGGWRNMNAAQASDLVANLG